MSHFGRPKAIYDNDGNVIDGATHKSQIISVKNTNMFKNIVETYKENDISVKKLNKCIGNMVLNEISNMSQKMLFYWKMFGNKGELQTILFSVKIWRINDIFVMDAFGTSHRKHNVNIWCKKLYSNIRNRAINGKGNKIPRFNHEIF